MMELSFMCNALKCFGVAKGTNKTTHKHTHPNMQKYTLYYTQTHVEAKNKKRQP